MEALAKEVWTSSSGISVQAYRTDKELEAMAVTSGGGGGGGAGAGFLVKVFKVFSLDRVQQRCVDQILMMKIKGK